MAISLEKGQRINLEKGDGHKLTQFCVGCNWGAISVQSKKLFGLVSSEEKKSVDLDLSCVMVDVGGNICDHIYSPLYRREFLAGYGLPPGKLDSADRALHHSGDDRSGDQGDDDGLDNEIITVDLQRVSENVAQIFFFLNNCGREDFSEIPYASIRMYEGTPSRVDTIFARYDVATSAQFKNTRALIMGKLYRRNGEWKFSAIGDAYPDENICVTIERIAKQYAR